MLSSSYFTHRAPTVAFALSALSLVSAAYGSTPTTPLSLPPPEALKKSTLIGRLPPATILSMSISLPPAKSAEMQAYADAVSNPRSPYFRRFLTPAQIGEKFGAPTSQVNSIVTFLKSKGMTVTLVAKSRLTILFKGRADKMELAFATKLNRYHNNDPKDPNAKDFFSFASNPKVPTTIAPAIRYLGGLQNYYKPLHDSTLNPTQGRAVYGVASLYNANPTAYRGLGVNVGVTNLDGYRLSNLAQFYAQYGLPFAPGFSKPNVTKVSTDGADGELEFAFGEGDLDLQMVMGMAPQCHLVSYDGFGFVAVYTRELEDNAVDVITESYSHPVMDDATRQEVIALHDLHVAMTAVGITYCDSSGDYGTDLTRGNGAPYFYPYPRIEPEITNVGGTVVTADATGFRISEEGWTGSGSGYTDYDLPFNRRPVWQVGSTVPSGINRRLWPDVALHASGTNKSFANYSSSDDFAWFMFGDGFLTASSGTSASSPAFAGELAVVIGALKDQNAIDPTPEGFFRLGRINDVLYALDGDPTVFYDVTVGDSGPLPNGTEAVCKPGWDFVTGWGAPNAVGLTDAFLAASSIPIEDNASAVDLFSTAHPNITYGTQVLGNVSALPSTDGVTYSAQSVHQPGVGQAAAITVDFALAGDPAKRRGAGVTVSFSNPTLTTGFMYLYNFATNTYDLQRTVTGTGATKTVSINSLDVSKYVQGNALRVMVRAMKPSRLGAASFRLSVDQSVVTERIARG